MQQISEIDITSQISSMIEPTMELRWQPRFRVAQGHFAPSSDGTVEFVLQQCWAITDYRGGQVIGGRSEWRDVPTIATP